MTFETGGSSQVDPSTVGTRNEFADFLQAVLQDCQANGTEWENGTLPRFLDALAAVAWSRHSDLPGIDQAAPTWGLFAEMVVAATGYE